MSDTTNTSTTNTSTTTTMKKRKSQNSPTISSSTIPLPPQQQEREVERTFDVINDNNHYEHDEEEEDEREITTHVFHDPSLFLSAVESELSLRPMQSNIVYAHAHKLRQHQQHQHQHQDHDEASGGAGKRVQPGQLWIALYSTPRHPPPKPLHNHHPSSTTTTTTNRSQRNISIITTAAAAVAAATASTSTGNGTTTTTTTSTSSRRIVRPRLEFVLSCTTGPLGDYPIFIYNALPSTAQTHHHANLNSKQHHKQQPSSSSSSFLQSRMDALATRLLALVPPSRVFSVFAPYNVTLAFAAAWTQQTEIEIVRGPPWYSATSSFCTLETFKGGATSLSMVRLSKLADALSPPTTTTVMAVGSSTRASGIDEISSGNEALFVDEGCWYEHTTSKEERDNDKDESDRDEGKKKKTFTTLLCHEIRRATMDDLDECAMLCQEFAELSPPFVLTAERARMEAEELIRCGLLWVYGLSPFLRPTTTTTTTTATSSSSSSAKEEEEGGEKTKVATLVAVTRSTPTVSAITKVYTTDRYRRRGYADRLVAHVTKYLLEEEKKEAVVLFVGHTLDA
ncbi:hypothetical protein FRC17_001140, partial [Serendipita sp. 399]